MENDPNEIRFRRIERRLNLLIGLGAAQFLVLLIILVKQMIPTQLTIIFFLVLLAGFLYVFRQQIPNWFGSFSRYFFAQIFASQKSDSMKDIK